MPATRNGGDYLQPNSDSRALWAEIIDHILRAEYADAHTKALTRNYQVTLFADTANTESVVHVLLERTPASTSRYWGTFVFNPSALRPNLVIQSSHPRFDSNTGYQSVRIYQHALAGALFLSGTHRCNGLSDSPCSGTTSVCDGDSQPYRYSDQAHVVLSTFQITTETMFADNPELVVIQPHGFAKKSGDPRFDSEQRHANTALRHGLRTGHQRCDPGSSALVDHQDRTPRSLLDSTPGHDQHAGATPKWQRGSVRLCCHHGNRSVRACRAGERGSPGHARELDEVGAGRRRCHSCRIDERPRAAEDARRPIGGRPPQPVSESNLGGVRARQRCGHRAGSLPGHRKTGDDPCQWKLRRGTSPALLGTRRVLRPASTSFDCATGRRSRSTPAFCFETRARDRDGPWSRAKR